MTRMVNGLLAGLAAAAILGILPLSSAEAMSRKDCSALYQQAKTAGTLNGMKWNDFRKAKCADTAAAPAAVPATPATPAPAPAAAPAPAPATPAPAPVKVTKPAPAAAPATPITTAELTAGGAAGEHARIKECGAEWKANKATLQAQYPTWPKYWSACDARIKTSGK
ncbi:hypothetical protein [Labrys wisconsinensis]|uniref:Membrane protein n=1 Tax=Labrys wisconsinensis TaxID=425677 RepID=A0ABU0JG83_9HYPH|nr:hypothetical protein [Labrys wisconsinensis]MDQ0473298.1 putative membrane protein [Labrys wisconsinensis]